MDWFLKIFSSFCCRCFKSQRDSCLHKQPVYAAGSNRKTENFYFYHIDGLFFFFFSNLTFDSWWFCFSYFQSNTSDSIVCQFCKCFYCMGFILHLVSFSFSVFLLIIKFKINPERQKKSQHSSSTSTSTNISM